MRDGCVFCDYEGPSPVLLDYGAAFVVEPLHPATPGHVLVVPRRHVETFGEDPSAAGIAARAAALYVREVGLKSYNVIANAGRAATQSIMHLHLHIVPRRHRDLLLLPWSHPETVQAATRERAQAD